MSLSKHLISLERARTMVARHTDKCHKDEVKNLTTPRVAFEALLAVPGCVEIRAHFAVHDQGHKTIVYTAVDAAGNDIIAEFPDTEAFSTFGGGPIVIDESRPCPPFCGGSAL